MNVKEFEKKEKNTAELTMEVSPEEFEAAVNKAYLKNKSKIAVPGFRKGKAPRKIIENLYGVGVFYEDAVEALYPEALQTGIDQQQIDMVGRPSILDFNIGEDKSLTIKFLVSLYPEVTLGQYKGIVAPKATVRVLKKDVDHEIEHVREQNARIETVEREAKSGDIANIDFEGFIDGVAFDGGKGESVDLELGSGQFIPGFEDQIIGAKAGDSIDVNVTFPKEYAKELAGKDATFKVTVNEVKEKILPDLDDEFAKDVSEFDTFAEYSASVKEQITESRKAEAQKNFEEVVLNRLVEQVQCDIPDAMIDEQVDSMINNFRYNLASQGMELEQYMSMFGMDLEAFKKDTRPTAEKQIKADLAFEAIAKQENFEISDEQIEEEYKKMAENYKVELDVVKKSIDENSIKTGLTIEAARKLVFDSAVIEKKEKKSEDKEEKSEDKTEEK
ncbi:MAG: trigger factor [Oscillospiraceae bacterium]